MTNTGDTSVIIPARYESSRLPGKVLLDHTGKYLMQHVYENAAACERVADVYIATADDRVEEAAQEFNADVIRTSTHKSGTDRVSEAAGSVETEYVVNLQADEPELGCRELHALTDMLEKSHFEVTTIAAPIQKKETVRDPNCVKVALARNGTALYFSRAPIPWSRRHFPDPGDQRWSGTSAGNDDLFQGTEQPSGEAWFLHIGAYGFRREVLRRWPELEPGRIEQIEQLEQLRLLENGVEVGVARVPESCPGVDTEAEYEAFVERTVNH